MQNKAFHCALVQVTILNPNLLIQTIKVPPVENSSNANRFMPGWIPYHNKGHGAFVASNFSFVLINVG